ncbi:MAG: NosD domain-containing protein, partial [bacterium]|nr:NosD domain-containing protein [bacterium]
GTGLNSSGWTGVAAIANGTWSASTTVSAVYGGTGQSTWTAGDLLYSNSANNLAKLGIGTGGQILAVYNGIPTWVATTTLSTITGILSIDKGGTNAITIGPAGSVPYSTGSAYAFSDAGTSGQALISGGAGSPTWGTLGVNYGGTGLNTLTQGYIPFGQGTSALGSDSNFFWDATNHRLGIGTTTPATALTVVSTAGAQLRLNYDYSNYADFTVNNLGELTISGSGASGSLLTIGDASANDAGIIFDGNAYDYYAALDDTDDAFKIGLGSTIGSNALFTILSNGYTGVGTTSPFKLLSVNGDAYISGNLTATGTITFNNIAYTFPSSQSASRYLMTDGSGALSWVDVTSTTGQLNYGAAGSLTYYSSAGRTATGTTGALLYWDNSNYRLGVNTASPSYTLDVAGTARITGTTTLATTTMPSWNKVIIVDGVHFPATGAGIQAAINSLPSTGGKVFIPEGTYSVTATITIPSFVWIEGAGASSTILRLANSANKTVIANSDATNGNSYIKISNLMIDGNDAGNTGAYCHGVYFTKVSYSEIDSAYVYDAEDYGVYLYGVSIGNGSNYNKVSNSIITSNSTGIYITLSDNNAIVDNKIYSNSSDGVYSYGGYGQNAIVDNKIYSNSGHGIYFFNNKGESAITGNTINSNSLNGIYIYYNSDGNAITGNTINSNTQKGIYVYNTSDNNTITGNTFISHREQAIQIGYNSNHNIVAGNNIHSVITSSGGGIYIYGSDNNIVSSNRITRDWGSGYAISIENIDFTADNNILVGNRYSGTGASSINDLGTGTIYNTQLVGNDLILKSAGNIGIGTTSPYAKLSVWGSGNSGLTKVFEAVDSASTTLFAILDNGNVGIASSSPFTKLGVIGNAYIQGNLTTTGTMTLNGITYTFPSSQSASQYLQTDGSGTLSWATIADSGTLNYGAAGSLTYYSSSGRTATGTTGALLTWDDTNARLGIGTTSPYSILSISNSASTAVDTPLFTIASTTAGVSTSTLFTVLANGNVGIGTASPNAQIHIEQKNVNTMFLYGKAANTYPDTNIMQFQGSGGNDIFYVNKNGLVYGFGGMLITSTNSYSFGGGWGGLSNTGLSLAYSPTISSGYGTTQGNLNYSADVADAANAVAHNFSTSGTLVTAGAKLLSVKNNTTEKFFIDKDGVGYFSGNVGIGTTTPYSKLSVWGTGTSGLTKVFEAVDSASTTLFAILDNGNIGIASSSPFTKLGIIGDAYIQGNLTTTGTMTLNGITYTFPSSQSASQYLQTNGSGGLSWATIADSGTLNYGAAGSLTYYSSAGRTATGTTGALLYWDDASARLGIGTTDPQQKLHVEGQCVTGDTKLKVKSEKLKVGYEDIEIKDVKGGEYVLSLNEKTGKLVPAKIKGLLDMGVKPIYEIETEDGKKIRTTGNHPYLVKDSKFDDNFALVRNGNIFQFSSDSKTINCPRNSFSESFDSSLEKEANKETASFCGMRNQTTEKTCDFRSSQKSESLVTNTLCSLKESKDNNLSGAPGAAFLTSQFCESNKSKSSARTFSSSNSLGLGVDDDIVFLSDRRGVTQGGADMLLGERGKGAQNFSRRFARGQQIQNLPDHNSGSFESGLAMADGWIGNNEFIDVNNGSHKNDVNNYYDDNYSKDTQNLSNIETQKHKNIWVKVAYLSEGDEIAVVDENLAGMKFSKIKKINILPAEQVYDIEVEGTHNFVANGIIAHNTYISGNTGIGTTSPYAILSISNSAGTAINTPLFTIASTTAGVSTSTLMTVLANGNVGIGTTNPQALLDVYGASKEFRLSYDSSKYARLYTNSDGDFNIYAKSFLDYGWSGNSLVKFGKSDGGSSYGETMLLLQANDYPAVLRIQSDVSSSGGGNEEAYISLSKFTNTDSDYNWYMGLDAGTSLRFGYSASKWSKPGENDLLVIDSTGSVGIGTTSPFTKLGVIGDAYIQGNLTTTGTMTLNGITYTFPSSQSASQYLQTNGSGGLSWATIADSGTLNYGAAGSLTYYSSSGRTATGTTGALLYWDDTNGRLGIGTTSPYAKLSIWGSGNLLELVNTSSTTVMAVDSSGNITQATWIANTIGLAYGGTNKNMAASAGSIAYSDSDSLELSAVGTAGQILMSGGTGAPAWVATSTFIVDNDFSANGIMVRTAAGTYTARTLTGTPDEITITNGDGVAGVPTFSLPDAVYLGTAGKIGRDADNLLDFSTDNQIAFRVNASNQMYLDSAGRLSIGTSTAASQLTILSSVYPQLRLSYDTDSYVDFTVDSAGQLNIGAATTSIGVGSEVMRVINGNVGIGTTSPYAKLSVWGNGTSGLTAFNVVNSASSTLFTVLDNGYVGIGTANPSYNLEVNGTVSFGSATAGDIIFDTTTITNRVLVGIGTSTPDADLTIVSDQVNANTYLFTIATSTKGSDVIDRKFAVDSDGDIFYDGSAYSPAADYAEYFYTVDTDLKSGEVVCVDVTKNNAVKRCRTAADGNVMGIVSTKPAIIGNAKEGYDKNSNYKIIGLLGQVQARVSTENGPIRPGDSLTSASIPGYVMRAEAGDSTVGVALEAFGSSVILSGAERSEESQVKSDVRKTTDSAADQRSFGLRPQDDKEGAAQDDKVETGVINVLISRRNKSLTVETVEEQITKRIADMEIEDEVNILIANAVNSLNLDEEIAGVLDPKLFLLTTQLTATADSLTGKIENIEDGIFNISAAVMTLADRQFSIFNQYSIFNNQITELNNKLEQINLILNSGLPALSTSTAFYITKDGNLKMGASASLGTSTPDVAIVEIGANSDKPAFVINQAGDGDVADFRADGVSIVNIGESGKVTIIGELLVDGRIMVCAGGACGAALDNAVDQTMGDMGVEGTIVAGAFAGYCESGFVWVPGSAKYGTLPGFCVQAGKARAADTNADGYADMSLNADEPVWVDVSQGQAQLACQSLGDNYHLLSENEWMTIAENVIRVAENDADLETEGMQLATSFVILSGAERSEESQVKSDVRKTTDSAADQRSFGLRPQDDNGLVAQDDNLGIVYFLTNGNAIYDLVGLIAEWTDQTVTKKGIFEPVSDEWQEYYDITDYKGFNIAPPYYYTSANGIGKIKTGDNENNLRGFVRGYDGIFSLDLSNSPATASSTIGFRCAR